MSAVVTVRVACRQRKPLDGTDAQALEHALTITERERDEAREQLRLANIDAVNEAACAFDARAEARLHEAEANRCAGRVLDLEAEVARLLTRVKKDAEVLARVHELNECHDEHLERLVKAEADVARLTQERKRYYDAQTPCGVTDLAQLPLVLKVPRTHYTKRSK